MDWRIYRRQLRTVLIVYICWLFYSIGCERVCCLLGDYCVPVVCQLRLRVLPVASTQCTLHGEFAAGWPYSVQETEYKAHHPKYTWIRSDRGIAEEGVWGLCLDATPKGI